MKKLKLQKSLRTKQTRSGLTRSRIARLDRLFQEQCLKDANYISLLGGRAEVVHHYKGRDDLALRWYKPNGIPLTNEQHNAIENTDRNMLESEIQRIKGKGWQMQVINQERRTAKNLNSAAIEAHIMGLADNYL